MTPELFVRNYVLMCWMWNPALIWAAPLAWRL